MPNAKVNADQNAVRRAAKQKQNAAARAKAANTKKTEAPLSLSEIRRERENRANYMQKRQNEAMAFIENVRRLGVGRICLEGDERTQVLNNRLISDVKNLIKSGKLPERFFWEIVGDHWNVTVDKCL